MKRLFLLAFFFGSLSAVHAETKTLRFEDLPHLVSAQNKNVLAGQSYVAGAKSQTGHWERSFLPKIRAEGGGEIFQTGNLGRRTEPRGSVEGRLNLFRSGKDRLEEKIRDTRAGFTEANFRQTYFRELSRARLLYADILYYDELLKSARQALSLTGEHLGLIQRQIKAGLTTDADRIEFEMLQNRLSQDELLFEEDYEHATEELKAVLGLSSGTSLKLDGSLGDFQEQDVLEMGHHFNARVNARAHHDVLALKKKAEIANLQKKQADRWWGPSLEAYGSYSLYPFREREYPALKNRDEAVGGLVLSFDLFDGLHAKTQGKAFDHQARGHALEAEQKSRELEVLFEKLKHELKNRRRLIQLMTQNTNQGGQYLKMSLEEYGRGVKTGPQLREASERLLSEKHRLASTRREYRQIKAEFLALLGK